MKRVSAFLCSSLLVLAGCGNGGGGKSAQVQGKVLGLGGAPMSGVTVRWVSKSATTTTATDGSFSFSSAAGTVTVDLKITGSGLATTVIPGFSYDTGAGKPLKVYALTQNDLGLIAQNYADASGGDTFDARAEVMVVARLLNILNAVCPHTATVSDTGGAVTIYYGDGGMEFGANKIPRSGSFFSFAGVASPGPITVTDVPTGNTYTATAAAGEVLFAYDEEMPVYAVVRGFVRDWFTNTPIAGATISIDGTALSTTSDANGEWLIDGVTANSVQSLTLTAAGFFTTHYPDNLVPLQGSSDLYLYMMNTTDYTTSLKTPLESAHGSSINLATDALVAGGFYPEMEYWSSGIQGATVAAVPPSASVSIYYLNAAGNAFSEPKSAYTNLNRPQFMGPVQSITTPADMNFKEKWLDKFTSKAYVKAGDMTVLRFCGLPRDVGITGTLVNTSSTPVPGMDMRLIDLDGNICATTTSGAGGAFTFPRVPGKKWYAIRTSDPNPSPLHKITISAYEYYGTGSYTVSSIIVDNAAYNTVKVAYETALGRSVNDTTLGCVAGEIRDENNNKLTQDTVVLSNTGCGLKYMSTTGQFNATKTQNSPGPQFLAAEIPPGAGSGYETLYGYSGGIFKIRYKVEAGAVTLATINKKTYDYLPAVWDYNIYVYNSSNSPLSGITVSLPADYPWSGEAGLILNDTSDASGRVDLRFRKLHPRTHFILQNMLGDKTICSIQSQYEPLYFITGTEYTNLKAALNIAAGGSGLDFTNKGVACGYLGYDDYYYDEPAQGRTVSVVGASSLPAYYNDPAGGMTYPYAWTHSLWQYAVPEVDPGEHKLEINGLGYFSDPVLQLSFENYFSGWYKIEAGVPSVNLITDSWLENETMPALFHVSSAVDNSNLYEGVENATVTVSFKDGPTYTGVTGPGGWVYFPALETRKEVTIKVQAPGHITTVIPAALPLIIGYFDQISNPGGPSLWCIDEDLIEHVRFIVDNAKGAGTFNPALSIGMLFDSGTGDTLTCTAPGAATIYRALTWTTGEINYNLEYAADYLPGGLIYNIPNGTWQAEYTPSSAAGWHYTVPFTASERTLFMFLPGSP